MAQEPTKKGPVRETAWFKKGELDQEAAMAQAAIATEDPLAPSGATGMRAAVDASEVDVSAQDQARLSLKTGLTEAPQPGAALKPSDLPGQRMDEKDMIAEVDNAKKMYLIAGGILVAVAVIVTVVMMSFGK